MPVVHIRALKHSHDKVRAALAALPEAVTAATGISPQRVWATFTPVAEGEMLVAGRLVEGHDDGPIVFVDLHVVDRGAWVTSALIEAASRCLAEHLEVPVEDIWTRALPIRDAGSVFAGGKLAPSTRAPAETD